jgi:hypothetical protein
MSRSGYDDCCDGWDLIRWRGAVKSAIRGQRGQAMLKELAVALDAMPEKKLIANDLESPQGVCAMGCLGKAKGLDMSHTDAYEPHQVAKLFGIADALAQEISHINDEWGRGTPEQRWQIVRDWVADSILTQ